MEVLTEKSKNLEKEILKVLAFLDIFNYPPTAMEIWRFLGVRVKLEEVIGVLSLMCYTGESENSLRKEVESGGKSFQDYKEQKVFSADARNDKIRNNIKGGLVQEKNGLYFLTAGKNILEKQPLDLVEARREFFHLAEKKSRIARRAARILRFVPGVKLAAVCNNFYYRPESDIDFFIVTSENRLWFTRALVTVALSLFGLRRHGKRINDRICLSFYVSSDNLQLSVIALKPEDRYLYYWLAFLEPVYDDAIYKDFWAANSWLKDIFPNVFKVQPVGRKKVSDNIFSYFLKKINSLWFKGFFGDRLEALSRQLQLKRMSAHSRERAGTGVIINDRMLKFHENDRRPEFNDKFNTYWRNLYENYQ